ncbi:endonuclease domain-containing protein [Acinetobacter sp. C32I]|uniref:endonuclease domain-containing protein n=1 Tax=Acinetobacter sp. C32I TaxID=2950074 RepID=UPI002036ED68|nr:endonuclease domain-containing protein [Acinetobacter sp. C32I]USA53391.1 endonuclease domain-containing protein [Acinetobacter sp. C32I]
MKLDPQLLEFAKTMRSNATEAEHLMWQLLRAKRFMNLKFRRQHVIAPYIVDFYCHELGLVIELDGSQHGAEDAIEYDAERTKFLEALDLKVVRYWNHEILKNTERVLDDLWNKCWSLSNKTSPLAQQCCSSPKRRGNIDISDLC